MSAPTGPGGRLLPRQDTEADDHTPGAAGWVTCGDTAAGRAVAWATNGRVDKDGSVYRAVTKDPDGITLQQLRTEVKAVASLDLVIPTGWAWGNCSFHLSSGVGLIVQGWYDALPAQYREQQGPAHFVHDMFACYRSTTGTKPTLVYDPLNRDLSSHGRWIPAAALRKFIESGGVQVAYLPNQPL